MPELRRSKGSTPPRATESLLVPTEMPTIVVPAPAAPTGGFVPAATTVPTCASPAAPTVPPATPMPAYASPPSAAVRPATPVPAFGLDHAPPRPDQRPSAPTRLRRRRLAYMRRSSVIIRTDCLGEKTQEYQPTFPNSEAHSPQPDESKKSQDIVRKA